LPLTDLFLPILSRLATAISQCQRIQDRTEALERANRELEAFSYSVSHDLRAPLRAIDGFSQMLVEDYGDRLDDEGKRLLGVVRANTARMGQLIDDILSFSRMARREIEAMPIDMTRLAHEVADELKAALGNRKVHFEIGQLPAAHGDRAMIRQVFVNLLSNAVKFTQARAEALVEVGSERAGEENCYYVRDNGVGFDMQYADKLFGTFVRLHGREQFEGTGIGLAIVKRIVLRHGGHVRGKGEVDKGAIFHFCLPLDAAEAV
jgi:two-component system sensor kinase